MARRERSAVEAERAATVSRFVEDFGLYWQDQGNPRMEGRLLAYLIIGDQPYVSSADLAKALQASAGSISTAARRLADVGFIKRHAVPGDRSHYYRVEDDVWGSFLAGERRYLGRQIGIAEAALAGIGTADTPTRRRLENMRDYMVWLEERHHQMGRDWEAFKARRTSQPD
jgi:hypothetical protein